MPDTVLFSPVLATTNLIDVFLKCDVVGQIITSGLAVFSIIAWSIMIGKHFELKRLRQLNQAFESHLNDQKTLLSLPESFRNKRAIPYADLFTDAIEAYWRAAAISKEKGDTTPRARQRFIASHWRSRSPVYWQITRKPPEFLQVGGGLAAGPGDHSS